MQYSDQTTGWTTDVRFPAGAARGADQTPPSAAEVRNACSYTSSPPYVFMTRNLIKHRDNFTHSLRSLLLSSGNVCENRWGVQSRDIETWTHVIAMGPILGA